MKRITSIFLASAMLLAINTSVSAKVEPIQEILNGDNIKISGALNSARKKQVTIQVLNPGREISELYGEEPAAFKDVVAYQGQVESDENGKFAFEFVIKGDPEKYKYFVTSTGFEVEDELDYYGSDFVDGIVGQINDERQKENSSTVEALINENYTKINITAPLYEKMKAEDPEKVSEVFTIFQNYPVAKDNAEVSTQLNKAVAVYYVNAADTETKLDNAACNFSEELGISKLSAYKVYTDFIKGKEKKDIQSVVLSDLSGDRPFETDADVAEIFENTVITDTFNNIDAWSEMKELLEMTKDVTGVVFDKCEDLTYPEKAYLELLSEEVDKVSSIKEKFDAAVKECRDEENDKGSSGGSGGGSGGSGGGFSSPSSYTPNNIQAIPTGFSDLTGYEWAKEDIYFLRDKKIVSGKSDTTFAPGAAITREEFVKLLVLAADLDTVNNGTGFWDVEKDSWYEKYVDTAVTMGVVQGLGDGRFGVGEEIKREDMAVMTERLLKIKAISLNGTENVSFIDESEISGYAFDAVKLLAQNGLLLGNENGEFAPAEKVTRAQAAVLLRRIYNLIQRGA